MLLLVLLDYQGLTKLIKITGALGTFGCAKCLWMGDYVSQLRKTIFRGYRRLLPPNHPFRSANKPKVNDPPCSQGPPPLRTQASFVEAQEAAVAWCVPC